MIPEYGLVYPSVKTAFTYPEGSKMNYLTYALHNGELIHIAQVVSGLACDCVCPACGERLIARKGNKVSHHFAHYNADECKFGYETSLHLAAKQIIAESKKIVIPPAYLDFQEAGKEKILLSEAKTIPINDVFLEKGEGDIIPDIILVSGKRRLFLEIYVSHAVDDVKVRKLKNHNVSMIEIDLSKYKEAISKEELIEIIISGEEHKRWIYNTYANKYMMKFREVSEYMPSISRGFAIHIEHCPLRMREWKGKPYANLIYDCTCCEFCISLSHKNGILCSGKCKISQIEDFKKTYEERSIFYENKYASINLKQISNGVCPYCGGLLINRKSQYGNFIGCSNYPHCHFKATVDEETGEIVFRS